MTRGVRVNETHDCAAPTCDIQIPMGRLMCQGHWFSLPPHIRRRVTGRWMAWQHDLGDEDKMASYLRVRAEAIKALP
jgi:hypothetical protein